MTRSVIAPMNATATLNLGGAGPKRCAVVELLDPHHPHVPIAAYAGDAAARVCEDSVEAAARSSLPSLRLFAANASFSLLHPGMGMVGVHPISDVQR